MLYHSLSLDSSHINYCNIALGFIAKKNILNGYTNYKNVVFA